MFYRFPKLKLLKFYTPAIEEIICNSFSIKIHSFLFYLEGFETKWGFYYTDL